MYSLYSGLYIYIYASVFRVNLPPPDPPWYGPLRPWPRAHRPTIRLCKAARLPYLPLFLHLVKFLANTMQNNIACEDYDSINHQSHQSTRTTGPQGGRWKREAQERAQRTVIFSKTKRLGPLILNSFATKTAQDVQVSYPRGLHQGCQSLRSLQKARF